MKKQKKFCISTLERQRFSSLLYDAFNDQHKVLPLAGTQLRIQQL